MLLASFSWILFSSKASANRLLIHLQISSELVVGFVQVQDLNSLEAVRCPPPDPVHHIWGHFLFAVSTLSLTIQRLLFLARKPVAPGEGVALLIDVSQHPIVDTRQLTQAFFDILLALSHTKFFYMLLLVFKGHL